VRGAIGGARGHPDAVAELAADQAAGQWQPVAAAADVRAAVAALADDQLGGSADPARARWPLVAVGAARPARGRGGHRPHPAAAGARPRGRAVVAAAKRPAVLVPGDDRGELAAHPAGLEGCRVASPAAGADRTPVAVAGAHHRGLAAAHARLGVAALQTPDAQPPARGERGELPAGPAAPHAAGQRHTGDPRGVQLPQQPDKRQRPGRRPRGQRLGGGGQPGGEPFAFTHPWRRSPERSGQHGGVRRAERGHKDLEPTLVGPGAAAGRAGADGAGPAVDLLGAAPLEGRGLAAGAHHPGWARVAQPPLLAARGAGRDHNAGRAGGHQRGGQVEQQPTACLTGRQQ